MSGVSYDLLAEHEANAKWANAYWYAPGITVDTTSDLPGYSHFRSHVLNVTLLTTWEYLNGLDSVYYTGQSDSTKWSHRSV